MKGEEPRSRLRWEQFIERILSLRLRFTHVREMDRRLDENSVITSIKEHYRNMERAADAASDGKAKKNLLGLTDSQPLRYAEADITTPRMAELLLQ